MPDGAGIFFCRDDQGGCSRPGSTGSNETKVYRTDPTPTYIYLMKEIRADVDAGVACTVATSGLLTASVTATWRVPSVQSTTLLPDAASVSSMEA